jgi:hypothetical protein
VIGTDKPLSGYRELAAALGLTPVTS